MYNKVSVGPGNCDARNSEVGADGYCYPYCKTGYSPVDNSVVCAENCPAGFLSSGATAGSTLACIKPSFAREIKPNLGCPTGADRQFDKCLLGCPVGSTKKFNLCVPTCPPNFVETPDGLSCQAEFTKRVATVREACYANETRVAGRVCLSPCSTGTVPYGANSELCYATVPANLWPLFWTGSPNFSNWDSPGPLISKVLTSRETQSATCSIGYESLNGQCFADCPTGASPLGTHCVVDCPATFTTSNDQSACLRPSYKRIRIRSFIDNAGHILLIVGVSIGVLLVLTAFAARYRTT